MSALKQHWTAILETMATEAIWSQLNSLDPVLKRKVQLMQEVDGSEATASFVLHHVTSNEMVCELLELMKESGHVELVDTVQTSRHIVKYRSQWKFQLHFILYLPS